MLKPGDAKNIYRSGNTENFFNTEFVDLLIFDDIFKSSNTENYES
ncbi:12414_t:CDS:2, partial [Gigaspora rosea]